MRLEEASKVANEIRAWLAPACQRIEIAGGVRRGKADVRDIEIVAVPRPAPRPVFGEPACATALDALLARLVQQWHLRWDRVTPRNGPKYKRLVHAATRQPLDLFLASPHNWGNILALRTGDSDFSRLLVTHRAEGGLMPDLLQQRDGYLHVGEGRIFCPEEAAFFRALGIDHVPPPETRTGVLARRLARGLVTP